jgi:hypothetical protein
MPGDVRSVIDLIDRGLYDEARELLLTIDHPKKSEWLRRLDSITASSEAAAPPPGGFEIKPLQPAPKVSTKPPAPTQSEADTRTGNCPNCGAPMTIRRGQRRVTCKYCDSTYEIGTKDGRIKLRKVGDEHDEPADTSDSPSEAVPTAAPKTPIPPSITDVGDFFLVNPANKDYVTGKAKNPPLGCGGSVLFPGLFMSIFVMVGLLVAGWAVTSWRDWSLLRSEGVRVTGWYTGRRSSTDDEGDTTYYAKYAFNVNERTYKGEVANREAYNQAKNVNQSVEVLYAASNPGISTLALVGVQIPIFETIFALFWNAITYLVTFGFLYSAVKSWQIYTAPNKQLLPGEVARCSYDSDYDRLSVRYAFASPQTGKLIKGRESIRRSDLTAGMLPGKGAPVMVLYVNDRLHKVM